MPKKKRILPFNCMPGSWGLLGESYAKAKAEYELDGDDLDIKLTEIKYGENSPQVKLARLNADYNRGGMLEYDFLQAKLNIDPALSDGEKNKGLLELDKKFNKISDYDYEIKKTVLSISSDTEKKLQSLTIDRKFEKITEKEYQKQLHTLKKEPWVDIITRLNPDAGGDKSKLNEVELDWNDLFIEKLKAEGYNGSTDEVIIKKWFTALCSAVAVEGGFVIPPIPLTKTKSDKDKPDSNFREYE